MSRSNLANGKRGESVATTRPLISQLMGSGAIILIYIANMVTQAAEQPTTLESAASPLEERFFHPPAEYASDFGNFRSPLIFQDGRMVKTAADWSVRRREILVEWHRIMGPWPPLIEKPKLEVLNTTNRDGIAQHRVRVEIAPGKTSDGYLLVPAGKGPFPAVFVPYYEPETSVGLKKDTHRDFGWELAKRGFVALAIGSPGGNAWLPDRGAAVCQPLSYLAYIAANCANALAELPAVDPKRLGIVGHSYGGKWALFGACLSERYACGVWSDPGIVFDERRPNVNYWDPWYLGAETNRVRPTGLPNDVHPRTGAYAQLVAGKHDLHELLSLMAPRPFLVSGGSEDTLARWPALNHVLAVYQLLGVTNRVAMTTRAHHDPTPESNAQVYAFFERFLKGKP